MIALVYTTLSSFEEAKALGKDLVQEKLAACVHITPQMISIYEWNGSVQESSEVGVLIKTLSLKIQDVVCFIKERHPYTLPCILWTTVDADALFQGWVEGIKTDIQV